MPKADSVIEAGDQVLLILDPGLESEITPQFAPDGARESARAVAERQVEYALIGGGLAAGNCARWLREEGADGSILLIGREPDLPYNRPPCSKGYLQGKESREEVLFRPPEWYEEQQIEALTRVSAMKLDLAEQRGHAVEPATVSFDKALMATGANVRRLNVPGCELDGIHYLRTLGNSDTIREDAAGKRVVLIGGSYIASEVAASLTELGSSCTLVMLESVVAQPRLRRAGRALLPGPARGARDRGPRRRRARALRGRRRARHQVITKAGLELEADAVVMGAGVVPDVTLARGAGLELGESGGVKVDSRLETSAPGVYAAGDIAEYESVVHGGRRCGSSTGTWRSTRARPRR